MKNKISIINYRPAQFFLVDSFNHQIHAFYFPSQFFLLSDNKIRTV